MIFKHKTITTIHKEKTKSCVRCLPISWLLSPSSTLGEGSQWVSPWSLAVCNHKFKAWIIIMDIFYQNIIIVYWSAYNQPAKFKVGHEKWAPKKSAQYRHGNPHSKVVLRNRSKSFQAFVFFSHQPSPLQANNTMMTSRGVMIGGNCDCSKLMVLWF